METNKRKLFMEEYLELCEKHNFCLTSDDPYCGVVITKLSDYPKEKYCSELEETLEKWIIEQ